MTDAQTKPDAAESFYASVLDAADLEKARSVEGLDEELAVLRLRLRTLLPDDAREYELMLKTVEVIARVAALRYRISPKKTEELAESVSAVLRNLGEQLFPERIDDV